MKKEWIFLTIALIAGVVFRLWFISLAPQPFGWDQYEYHQYARKILEHGWLASHSYRSYPYPMFVAVMYALFGFENFRAVWIAQAILDSATGILVYFLLKGAVKSRGAPRCGLFLYLFNPWTSGYVGVMLSEVLNAFFIIATVYTGMLFIKKPAIIIGVMVGLLAGLAAETRNAAFLWAAIPIGLSFSFARHSLAKLGVIVGVVLTVLYPLWVNWRDYHEINITTVDDFYAKEFFQGALIKKLAPFTYRYPIESHRLWSEYYSEYDPGRSTLARRQMAQKYYAMAWKIIRADPMDYLKTRFFKMWYVWQKENVFFYTEPNIDGHRMITYWGNAILLLFAAIGLLLWPKKSGYVRLCIIGTILYGSLAFSLTHAEYRLTIPFYPLIITASSAGLVYVIKKINVLPV